VAEGSGDQVAGLRDSPAAGDSLGIVAATLTREARALTTVDLDHLAHELTRPVLLFLGSESPAWAGTVTQRLNGLLADSTLVTVRGHGHEGVDTAPEQVGAELSAFLSR
jgi:pimeloyl-ACP methyl ester carboxylesterase